MCIEIKDVLIELESLGNDKRKKFNKKNGAGDNQFGVPIGKLRALGKRIGKNHSLGFKLWNTGNTDAMFLATILFDKDNFSYKEIDNMVKNITYSLLLDEFIFTNVSKTNYELEFIQNWIYSKNELIGRSGWNIVVSKIISKKITYDEIDYFLNIIRKELTTAPKLKQDAMNRALCEIGIRIPKYTDKCIAIGEELGVYKDLKVSTGCTSPYAPEWINAGIKRKK